MTVDFENGVRGKFLVSTKHGEAEVSAVPVNGKRVLVLAESVPFDGKEGHVVVPRGSVLHISSRWKQGRYDIYETLWDAASGLRRVQKRAGEREFPMLSSHLRATQLAVDHLRKYAKMGRGVIIEAAELAKLISDSLANAENEHKAKALENWIAASNPYDSRKRPNPGRTAALYVAGNASLVKRLAQLERMMPFLDEDFLAIDTAISECEDVFAVALGFADKVMHDLLRMEKVDGPYMRWFGDHAQALRQMFLLVHGRPYVRIAEQIRDILDLQRFERGLDKRDVLELCKSVRTQAHISTLFRRVLSLNVESGGLEVSALKDEDFAQAARRLGERTVAEMHSADKYVLSDSRSEARRYTAEVKRLFAESATMPRRTWMRQARFAVRDFAQFIH